MGILHSPVILLIVGISSLIIVHGQRSDADHILDDIIRMMDDNQFVEPGALNQKYREYREKVKTTCAVNGGPLAYNNAQKGWKHFVDCGNIISRISPRTDNESLVNKLDPFINQWCPMIRPFDHCIELFSISVKPCLGEDERDIIDKLWKSVLSLLNYLCENEGEHIKTFYTDRGIQCILAHQKALTACVESSGNDTTKKNDLFVQLPLNGPNITECESFEAYQRCTIEVIEECDKPSISEIIESLFDILSTESGCGDLLKSNASPTTVVNFFLVTAVIAMFL